MKQKNARILWFHNRVVGGNYPNEYLLAEKFGVSKRQAERDIRFMREQLNAPLEYSAQSKGFYYTEKFSLPSAVTTVNDDDYSGITAKFTAQEAASGNAVQLQIPYTAELEIHDKLAALELKNFAIALNPKKGIYVCEFHSVELFLGLIMSLNADIRIISPRWLRERAVSSAEKILNSNKE